MKDAFDPFAIAKQLQGDIALSVWQLTQLRALNTKYWSALHALEHGEAGARVPSEEELAALQRRIAADIREMLTPDQRAVVDGDRSRSEA